MINLIEIATEGISILLCLHKLSGRTFIWRKGMLVLVLIEILGIVMQRYLGINYLLTVFMGVITFLYIKWYLTPKNSDVVRMFGIMFVLIPCMQLVVYYLTKFLFNERLNPNVYGIGINLLESVQMSDELYREAGVRIQQIRNKRGYTREALAEMADISNKFLYEVENGKKGFSASILVKIANALEISCDYILNGSRKKGSYNPKLLETIELFSEEEIINIINLLEIVYKVAKQ